MSDKNQSLKNKLEKRISTAKRIIASKQAAIARAEIDLANLENATARLEKQREKRVSKSSASRKDREVKSALKPNVEATDKIEIPTVEMDLPAPAPAVPDPDKKEEKKSIWSSIL